MKKKTHTEYVQELSIKNPNLEVIGIYIDAKTKIQHRCKKHNIIWDISPSNALKGQGCEKCKYEKMRDNQLKTHEQYLEEVIMKNPHVLVIETYVGASIPILHKCKYCGKEWHIRPSDVLEGKGCRECSCKRFGVKIRKSHIQYIDDLSKVNINIEPIEEYINTDTNILHQCKICGHRWSIKPNHTLLGHGCPMCNESRGERCVSLWLQKYNFKYIPQYKFDDCRDKLPLPFDFYLPQYNICIEYDGEQHFKSKDWFGGKETFNVLQHHDNLKNDYCKNHNITLLRISYQQDIEEELNKFLLI